MKTRITVVLLAFLTASGALGQVKTAYRLAYQDSIRVVLETNTNTETSMVGGVFATAWHKLSLEQREMVKEQADILRRRKFPVFPVLTDYYGAVAFAVEKEGADEKKMNSFLKLARRVIDKENNKGIASFFLYCRDFFEYHALHYERKAYRLYAKEDDYHFEYIEEPGSVPADTTKLTDKFNQWDQPKQDNNTVWQEDTTQVKMDTSPYMQPAPQPVLSGPVLVFDVVTFQFSTTYDSAFLRNTRGRMSLRDGRL